MTRFPLQALALLALTPWTTADVVTLDATQDNTLYESTGAQLSNGLGFGMFTGRSGEGRVMRALVQFDVAAGVPAGATITNATLELTVTTASSSSQVVDTTVHRVLAPWGEGTSDAPSGEGGGTAATPGDATWLNNIYPGTTWATPGGDFDTTASANALVSSSGSYSWTSATLAADVQSFLDSPTGNYGWMLRGSESGGAKRYATIQSTASIAPKLVVEFTTCTMTGPATETVRLGTPPNPNVLMIGTTGGPVLGTTWRPLVDHSMGFANGAVLDVLYITPGAVNVPFAFGTLLANPTVIFEQQMVTPGTPFFISVPDDCSLVGFTATAQAAAWTVPGIIELTNAIDFSLGTF